MHTSIEDIKGVGFSIINRKNGISYRDTGDLLAHELRRWKAHFGPRPEVCLIAWSQIRKKHSEARMIHFFMALYFLKSYNTEEQIGSRFDLDPKTVWKWIWTFIFWIAQFAPKVVSSSVYSFVALQYHFAQNCFYFNRSNGKIGYEIPEDASQILALMAWIVQLMNPFPSAVSGGPTKVILLHCDMRLELQ
jgi:hypothetical protein